MRRALPLFLAAAIATSGCDAFKQGLAKGRDAAVDKQLANTAIEINKSMPKMAGEHVQIDRAVAMPGKVLEYDYTLVDIDVAHMDVPRFEQAFKPNLLEKIKTAPELAPLRELGVTFAFSIQDKNGRKVGRYEFGPKDYTI